MQVTTVGTIIYVKIESSDCPAGVPPDVAAAIISDRLKGYINNPLIKLGLKNEVLNGYRNKR